MSKPSKDAGAPDEIEITDEMVEVGLAAYYAVRRYRGDEPVDAPALRRIYSAMRSMEPESM